MIAYQKKLDRATQVPKALKLNNELENKRKTIIQSFSLAKDVYTHGSGLNPSKESELQVGAEFLEVYYYFRLLLSLQILQFKQQRLLIYNNVCFVSFGNRVQSNKALSLYQENRLKQLGATIRSGSSYLEKMKMKEEKEKLVRNMLSKMTMEQLSDLMSFHHMMTQICSDMIETRMHDVNDFEHDS